MFIKDLKTILNHYSRKTILNVGSVSICFNSITYRLQISFTGSNVKNQNAHRITTNKFIASLEILNQHRFPKLKGIKNERGY